MREVPFFVTVSIMGVINVKGLHFDQAQQAPVQHIIEVMLHVPLLFCNFQNTNQLAKQALEEHYQ